MIAGAVAPELKRWADAGDAKTREARTQRAAVDFGLDGRRWNEVYGDTTSFTV